MIGGTDDIDDRGQLMAAAAEREKERAGAGGCACSRCAALEAEVARLKDEKEHAVRCCLGQLDMKLAREKELIAARALLGELAAAARQAEEYLAFITGISDDLEWGQRQRALAVAEGLREVLRRADSEAGGGEGC